MADSLEAILSVQDAVQESSWQTRANGGRAESAETDIVRGTSSLGGLETWT
jgi:hypothetical protein